VSLDAYRLCSNFWFVIKCRIFFCCCCTTTSEERCRMHQTRTDTRRNQRSTALWPFTQSDRLSLDAAAADVFPLPSTSRMTSGVSRDFAPPPFDLPVYTTARATLKWMSLCLIQFFFEITNIFVDEQWSLLSSRLAIFSSKFPLNVWRIQWISCEWSRFVFMSFAVSHAVHSVNEIKERLGLRNSYNAWMSQARCDFLLLYAL